MLTLELRRTREGADAREAAVRAEAYRQAEAGLASTRASAKAAEEEEAMRRRGGRGGAAAMARRRALNKVHLAVLGTYVQAMSSVADYFGRGLEGQRRRADRMMGRLDRCMAAESAADSRQTVC